MKYHLIGLHVSAMYLFLPMAALQGSVWDIMENIEGWHSIWNNVLFYKFFVSMHWNSFFAYWMGGLKRVFGTLRLDILWKDNLNHIICDYLNRELRSIDKIVHWQTISVGIFGVQNSLEFPWYALLKSCLFLHVCFQKKFIC